MKLVIIVCLSVSTLFSFSFDSLTKSVSDGIDSVSESVSDGFDGVTESISDATNTKSEKTILVKSAYLTEKMDAKSKVIKSYKLEDKIIANESKENENWLAVYETLESEKIVGFLPKSATDDKSALSQLSNAGGTVLGFAFKTDNNSNTNVKEKGFSKERKHKFVSTKGFTTKKNKSGIAYNYEPAYMVKYFGNLEKSQKEKHITTFAKRGGLK